VILAEEGKAGTLVGRWKSLITGRRSEVRATARAGALAAAGASCARAHDSPDFFPSGTVASALIVPTVTLLS